MSAAGEKVARPTHLPWRLYGTSIYFADVAGGFDVRNCPDPINLAAYIHEACNNYDALLTQRDALEAREKVLREALAMAEPFVAANCDGGKSHKATLSKIRALLATGAAK